MGEMGAMGHFGMSRGQMITTHFSIFYFAFYDFISL